LFHIPRHDYRAWCKGLKKSGYASIKDYDKKLIRVIEKYKLYLLDYLKPGQKTDHNLQVLATAYPLLTDPANDDLLATTNNLEQQRRRYQNDPFNGTLLKPISPDTLTRLFFSRPLQKGTFRHNGLEATFIRQGDTPARLAKRHKIKVKQLLRYNDWLENAQLPVGAIAYLEPKRKTLESPPIEHLVRLGETTWEVAQIYGIRYDKICRDNFLQSGFEPRVGEVLYIGKAAPHMPRVCTNSEKQLEREEALRRLAAQ
jgi:LysM repeat protein